MTVLNQASDGQVNTLITLVRTSVRATVAWGSSRDVRSRA
jgi:hypothetical protein